MKIDPDVRPLEHPSAVLERSLIEAFLVEHGHDPQVLYSRTDAEARAILTEAAKHAAGRLAEVDCRAHYARDIHGVK
ncbi:MAG: hypothetical protein WDN47_01370 [Candidatus Doudnabacteria bacterium]